MARIELVNGPIELYWAAVGTVFPAVDAAPSTFTLVGTSGDENYAEDGVSINLDQTLEIFRSLGSAHPIHPFRTEQEITVTVTLHDLKLDQLRVAMDLLATTDAAGPPSTRAIGLDYGLSVSDVALLVRGTGKSPELAGANIQFEINRAVEMGAHELSFVKGEPVGLELEFLALLDDNGALGQIIAVKP